MLADVRLCGGVPGILDAMSLADALNKALAGDTLALDAYGVVDRHAHHLVDAVLLESGSQFIEAGQVAARAGGREGAGKGEDRDGATFEQLAAQNGMSSSGPAGSLFERDADPADCG